MILPVRCGSLQLNVYVAYIVSFSFETHVAFIGVEENVPYIIRHSASHTCGVLDRHAHVLKRAMEGSRQHGKRLAVGLVEGFA
ncbi:hypothetical protein CBM2633_A110071 [Cupriavidus taiwanensis]|nr:hypothetical protein CBM2633_A110071 [Cupriavidus taiwanensis]